MEDLKLRTLPKWPQMYTTGKSVTVDQAKEIIRRTDNFFSFRAGGNDKDFILSLKTKFGIPFSYFELEDKSKFDRAKYNDEMKAWQDLWKAIEFQYIQNDWIASCFMEGPHGWCSPEGNIGYVDNVGKWPSIEAVYDDWVKVAEAFPFLDIGVTLMNCESTQAEDPDFNAEKVVSFIVKDGNVDIADPKEEDVHKDHELPKITKVGFVNRYALSGLDFECGIKDKTWFDQWARLTVK